MLSKYRLIDCSQDCAQHIFIDKIILAIFILPIEVNLYTIATHWVERLNMISPAVVMWIPYKLDIRRDAYTTISAIGYFNYTNHPIIDFGSLLIAYQLP